MEPYHQGQCLCIFKHVIFANNKFIFVVAYSQSFTDPAGISVEKKTDVFQFISDEAEESLDAYNREYMVAASFAGTSTTGDDTDVTGIN